MASDKAFGLIIFRKRGIRNICTALSNSDKRKAKIGENVKM